MGRITSLFVHKVIRQVDASIDRRAMLRSVGVDPDAPVDPKVMVSTEDYYTYLETIDVGRKPKDFATYARDAAKAGAWA